MKRVYITSLIVALILIGSLGAFVIYLQASGQIKFIPDKFSEEFLKFLANLISIIFGFVLVNVFWAQRESQEKINQVKQVLSNYLRRINDAALRISVLLSASYSVSELDASKIRDAEIIALIRKLEKLADGLDSLSFDSAILSDPIIQKVFVEIIWERVLPDINSMSDLHNFRKSLETFSGIISSIANCSSEGVNYL